MIRYLYCVDTLVQEGPRDRKGKSHKESDFTKELGGQDFNIFRVKLDKQNFQIPTLDGRG